MLGININMEKGLLTVAHNWYPWNFQHIIWRPGYFENYKDVVNQKRKHLQSI